MPEALQNIPLGRAEAGTKRRPKRAGEATRRSGVLEAAARCPADAKEQLPGNGRLVAWQQKALKRPLGAALRRKARLRGRAVAQAWRF